MDLDPQKLLDAACILFFLGFFAILIYATVIRARRAPDPIAIKAESSPELLSPEGLSYVGLFCSLCRGPAGKVSAAEYARLVKTKTPVHCSFCMIAIEGHKAQVAQRAQRAQAQQAQQAAQNPQRAQAEQRRARI